MSEEQMHARFIQNHDQLLASCRDAAAQNPALLLKLADEQLDVWSRKNGTGDKQKVIAAFALLGMIEVMGSLTAPKV